MLPLGDVSEARVGRRARTGNVAGTWKKRNYKQWFDEGMKCVKAIDRHATKSSPSLSVPTLKSITDLKACMRRAYRKMHREKEAHAAVRSSTLKMDKAKRQLEEARRLTHPYAQQATLEMDLEYAVETNARLGLLVRR